VRRVRALSVQRLEGSRPGLRQARGGVIPFFRLYPLTPQGVQGILRIEGILLHLGAGASQSKKREAGTEPGKQRAGADLTILASAKACATHGLLQER